MRLLRFALPHDPAPRVGLVAHDGGRVVDLSEVGVRGVGDFGARLAMVRQVASHLLHAPGAAAWRPAELRALPPLDGVLVVVPAAGRDAPLVLDGGRVAGAEGRVEPHAGAVLGAGLAAVVAVGGQDIPEERAASHLAGLAPVLVWRGGDAGTTAAAMGPWLATFDELSGLAGPGLSFALEAAVAVDGQPLRRGPWGGLAGRLAAAVSRASAMRALEPGDAVCVASFELDGARGGDVLLEVERLGTLRVAVGEARPAIQPAPAG